MEISQELVDLRDKQSGDMEKKIIDAYTREHSVEAIVAIAMLVLKGGEID